MPAQPALRRDCAGRPPEGARGAHALRPHGRRGARVRALGGGGHLQPRAGGRRGRELLDRGAAAERHRRAAHGPRAERRRSRTCCIRLARMRGRRAKWIFGTDHAGHRHPAPGREAARGARARPARSSAARRSSSACGSGASEYGATITEQFQALGASLDYARRALHDGRRLRAGGARTCSCACTRRGSIYRDNYMVNWDPGLRSAISDLEVEQRDGRGHALHGRLPARVRARARSRSPPCARRRCSPTPRSRCTPSDERYTRLIGETAILPLVGRRLPIIADEYVDPEFGTGALKITPGHDPNDFEIGRRHGLDEVTVIGEDGRMTDAAGRALRGPRRGRGARRRRRRAARARASSRARSRTSTTCRTRTARGGASSR